MHLVVLQFPTMHFVVIRDLLIHLNVSVKFELCIFIFPLLVYHSKKSHVNPYGSKNGSVHSYYDII